MSEARKSTDEAPSLFAQHLGALIAAATIVSTGCLYLSGTIYSHSYAATYGVRGLIETDLYSVTTFGAFGIVWLLLTAILFFIPLAGIVKLASRLFAWKLESTLHKRMLASAVRGDIVAIILVLSAIFLSFGMAGSALAFTKSTMNWLSLQNGCSKCFSYRTSEKSVYGLPVLSDQDRVAILLPNKEVVMLQWDEVDSVSSVP